MEDGQRVVHQAAKLQDPFREAGAGSAWWSGRRKSVMMMWGGKGGGAADDFMNEALRVLA